jgi:hypothetical protein
LGARSRHKGLRVLDTSLNFLNFAVESLGVLRDIESLAHKRVTDTQDFLPGHGTFLEYNNINCFVFQLAIFCSLSPLWLIIYYILEDCQSFSTSCTEQEFLQAVFLCNFNCASNMSDAYCSILDQRSVVSSMHSLNTGTRSIQLILYIYLTQT